MTLDPSDGITASAPATGVNHGCLMSINASNPAAFDVTAGVAYLINAYPNATVFKVNVPAQTVVLDAAAKSRSVNWWVINADGSITSQESRPTANQRRNKAQIGVTASTLGDGHIYSVVTNPTVLGQAVNQSYDFMYAVGPFSASGNVVKPVTSSLNVSKTSGVVFTPGFNYSASIDDPHNVQSPAEAVASWRYATQAEYSETAPTTTIDPNRYDVNGVLTPVPNNAWTIQRVYLFGTGIAPGQLAVQFGQATYLSRNDAIVGVQTETFVKSPGFDGIGALISCIVVESRSSDLSNAAFVIPARFSQ